MTRAWLAAAILAGCSASDSPGPGDLLPSGTDLSSRADLAALPGADLSSTDLAVHYGNQIGDTFPTLTWEGYKDDLADAVATTKAYGAYSTDDLRLSGRRYALIHTSEFY